MRDRHDLPLQAFGGVDGEDLHPPGGHTHLGGRQTVLHDRGGVEVGQQASHIGVGAVGVAGDDIGEAVEMFGAGAVGVDRAGRTHLGVDTQDPAHLGGQIGDRVGQEAAQPHQLRGQCGDARIALLRIGLRCARIGQGIGQAGGLGVSGGRGHDLLHRVGHDALAVEDHCAPPQRGQILGAEAPARAGQHHHRGRTRGGIGHQAQHRQHLRHLGNRQQAGQSDHLDWNAAGTKRLGDGPGVGIAPHQHRRRGRLLPVLCGVGVAGGDVIGQPITFGHNIVVQYAQHGAGLGAGPRPQRTHRHRAAPRRRGDLIGQVQGTGRVAPTGAQFECGRRGTILAGEVGGEPRQVGGRGAAPAVDRLNRITHRGQRQAVIATATEQCRQRDALGVAGVLIFVEQHHPVARPQLLTNLRVARGQPGGRRHLRTEVHHLLGAHPGVQRVDERHQHGAPGLGVEHVEQCAVGSGIALAGAGGQGVHEPFEFDVGVPQLAGVDQMLGELIGERAHHRGDRGRVLVDGQRVWVVADDVEG